MMKSPPLRGLGRSKSTSFLFSDSIPPESARVTAYAPLSPPPSVGGGNAPFDPKAQKKTMSRQKKDALKFISRVFTFARSGGAQHVIARDTVDDRRKRRSRWLPDPNQRWPVQGW